MSKNVIKTVQKLIDEVYTIDSNYTDATAEKHHQLEQLGKELEASKQAESEYFRMYVSKEVTQQAYNEQKDNTKDIQNQIKDIENELKLIEQYKAEDIDKHVAEIKKHRAGVGKHRMDGLAKVKKDIQTAKSEYLKKLQAIGKDYDSINSLDDKIHNILHDYGYQKNVYTPIKQEELYGLSSITEETAFNYL